MPYQSRNRLYVITYSGSKELYIVEVSYVEESESTNRTGQTQTKNYLNTLDFICNSSSNGDSNGHDH